MHRQDWGCSKPPCWLERKMWVFWAEQQSSRNVHQEALEQPEQLVKMQKCAFSGSYQLPFHTVHTLHGVLRQEYWSGLPFPSPVDHVLSELSTMTRPSWVALHGVAHSFIELDKAVVYVIILVSFLWLCLLKLVLEKAEGQEIKLPNSSGSSKKQESSRKTSISALLTMPKPLSVWITINCGKFWKRWEYQTTWPTSWKICMQVRKQQLELDTEQ